MNKIDACLSYYLQKYPALLLIAPVQRKKSRGSISPAGQMISKPADSVEEIESIPNEVTKNILILLRFLSGLMANSSSKGVFNSVEELVDLLGAADDDISAMALEVLCFVSTPPALHRQQAPEMQQHTSTLHSSQTESHERILSMARGWGTKGAGLGLHSSCTADDSEFGQGTLPKEAGELRFTFSKESGIVELTLGRDEIIHVEGQQSEVSRDNESNEDSSIIKQKRRRVAPVVLGQQSLRSVPELFLLCIGKAGGRNRVPNNRIFDLLVEVRLARSFYCRSTRVDALQCRLRAIIAALYSHPSQEIMSGYFQAQPELCVELTDLLRPTVSSASVSAAVSKMVLSGQGTASQQDALTVLANSPSVPYNLRELSLQALTALIGRRDGTTGALQGAARHSVVLTELGVGKGQYLGLLPTLIRFSLASLSTIIRSDETTTEIPSRKGDSDEDIAFEIGLAFVQTTMPPPLSRSVQVIKGLEFIDSVLTLTSAVVSSQSGTSSLTECGIIPALLTTVTVDFEEVFNKSGLDNSSVEENIRIKALLRFVTAQAIQIIEGTIVTQTNALKAFHELNGVEVLTSRLAKEILPASLDDTMKSPDTMDCDKQDETMAKEDEELKCSQRVLLYSIVTCLTVVFHQESTSSHSASLPSGATQLRKPELTTALIYILQRIDKYGGHLISLIATLLADVMNSDPHVVRHVHESGLAKAFLGYFPVSLEEEPIIPPIPELIMTIPSVIAALALTEDGANVVKSANPFPALVKIFAHPKYAMPQSRCLLNEMAAVVGTGLDEIMRHTTSLRSLVTLSISEVLNYVAEIGEKLAMDEKDSDHGSRKSAGPTATDLENQRSCLMQYAVNFGQLLEQILHTEEHAEPFVKAGGLKALLKLFPCLLPTGLEFLSHISCLSCPSVSTLGHASTEDAINLAFRCVALRYNSFELIKTVINATKIELDKLKDLQGKMRLAFPTSGNRSRNGLDAVFILDGVPTDLVPAVVSDSHAVPNTIETLAEYLRQVAIVQWITSLLAAAIKIVCQRSAELGGGWSRQEREWKKELSSTSFEELFDRLNEFQQSTFFEACRIRSSPGFEERERARRVSPQRKCLRYRLRIVCPEGAVVRDGIEIDSCTSVGNMEMGEIAHAFDRCVNSSGVLRYRTSRGWVSEQTRGHGREPIAEILGVWEAQDLVEDDHFEAEDKRRVESAISDIQTASAGILARMQTSYSDLYVALSKVSIQGVRSIPLRSLSFQPGTIGGNVATILRMLQTGICSGFNFDELAVAVKEQREITSITKAGISLYFGGMLSHLRAVLYEEKRDRRTVNVPLLIAMHSIHESGNLVSIFDAISFVLWEGLDDFEHHAASPAPTSPENKFLPRICQSRSTAASLPAAVALIKRLIVGSTITSSPLASVLSRVKQDDMPLLLGKTGEPSSVTASEENLFSPEVFFRHLLCTVSKPIQHLWFDARIRFSPPFVMHPLATLVSETVAALEESVKKTTTTRNVREEAWLSNAFRGLVAGRAEAATNQAEVFEPSEEAVSRLMEMGFSRDHAWVAIDTTQSNQLEAAMEYALSHPPPTAQEVEQRRSAAEERRRNGSRSAAESNAAPRAEGNGDGETNNTDSEMQVDQSDRGGKAKEVDQSILHAKECLESWKTKSTSVACEILSEAPSISQPPPRKGEIGDGNSEATTVVLSSFLLNMTQRYPDQQEKVTQDLFGRLDVLLSHFNAEENTDSPAMASLCHSVVVFIRALPKTRTLLLKNNTVGKVVGCLQRAINMVDNASQGSYPAWLAPAILLLDVMAQPIVAFPAKGEKAHPGELGEAQSEHRAQSKELSSLANALFGSSKNVEKEMVSQDMDKSEKEKSSDLSTVGDGDDDDRDHIFHSVPPYFPLLTRATQYSCAQLCMQLLDGRFLTPSIVHAILLLLLRLTRSPSLSLYCVKAGLAEKLLSLPVGSRFTGHVGLSTLIFRRLLEDEATLQSLMETEIRSILLKNRNSDSSGTQASGISRKVFMQKATALLCRDPATFLKAVSTTVKIEKEKASGGDSEGSVSLLSIAERARAIKAIDSKVSSRSSQFSRTPAPRRSSLGRSRRGSPRRKSSGRNKRSATPKRGKKDRVDSKDKGDEDAKMSTNSVSMTNLLASHAIKIFQDNRESGLNQTPPDLGFKSSFLWTAEILGILSDLVLAIPACATAIHKFRSNKPKTNRILNGIGIQHALHDCPAPPKTFVGFLLHYMVTMDRSVSEETSQSSTLEGNDGGLVHDPNGKRAIVHRQTKVAQASARLLFSLVARPGEGRRRVIGELAFALSGGMIGLSASPAATVSPQLPPLSLSELQALSSWGDLCLGLAAPRNSGSNYDDDKTLSVDVIRIMLDVGMVHAILLAIHRVDLRLAKSNYVISLLLLPFEVLSRPSVCTAARHAEEKEAKSAKEKATGNDVSNEGPKDRNDSFADDPMLEEAFARAPRVQHVDETIQDGFVNSVDDMHLDHGDGANHSFADAEEQDMEEVELAENDMDVDNDGEDDEDSDEEMSSSEESIESSDDDDDSSSDDSDEDDESIIDDDEASDGQEADSVEHYSVDYNDDALVENEDFRHAAPAVGEVNEGTGDDWTRIEATGMIPGNAASGFSISNRRGLGQQLRGLNAPRGFLDAAEAMIGTLLRTGEIQGEALADLEGSLGIRLVGATERVNAQQGPGQGMLFSGSSGVPRGPTGRSGEAVGAFPLIQQRNQPDVGYANPGDGRRWSVSSTEYIYGGPSLNAGSRNYELVPRAIDVTDDTPPLASQIDAPPLFPGGPAAVAHSREPHALHALLYGLDLPPMNALVSDIFSHGVRETRREGGAIRSPSDWRSSPLSGSGAFVVSTPNGNIIRSGAGASGLGLSLSAESRGFSDDGGVLDATAQEFSAAFDRALGTTMVSQQNHTGGIENGQLAADQAQDESGISQGGTGESPEAAVEASDGETAVVSSLASALRLSAHDEMQDQADTADANHVISQGGRGSEVENISSTNEEARPDVENTGPVNNENVEPDTQNGSSDNEPLQEESDTASPPGLESTGNEAGDSQRGGSEDDDILQCPPDIDPEVFNSLPVEMQREVIEQAQITESLASQLDAGSSLDPEALAALPEDMRREVIEQEQRQRRLEDESPADPANAEEMDNASFVASLAPDLREEILRTAEDAFIESLPTSLRTEAQVLRERESTQHRRMREDASGAAQGVAPAANAAIPVASNRAHDPELAESGGKRKQRMYGKIKVDVDRETLVYTPQHGSTLTPPLGKCDFAGLLQFFYLLSPLRPQRVLHSILQNMSGVAPLRLTLLRVMVRLLHDDHAGAMAAISSFEKYYNGEDDWRFKMDKIFQQKIKDFPPAFLIGAAPAVGHLDDSKPNLLMIRRKQHSDTAAAIAASLPISARGSQHDHQLPPVVASRFIEAMQLICKNSPRFCISILVDEQLDMNDRASGFDQLLDLLEMTRYSKSSANLEQLLTLLEAAVSPLSNLPKHGEDDTELSVDDIEAALSAGKQWMDVPRVVVTQHRLQLLCSILRMETCRESSFVKVNTIARRLCRVEANRGYILAELASVARALGADAMRDLKALNIRMSSAIEESQNSDLSKSSPQSTTNASTSIAVSTSLSELKLLRVLQTLQSLCIDVAEDGGGKKDSNTFVTEELVHLLKAMELDELWAELTSCMKVVQILEGVQTEHEKDGDGRNEGDEEGTKKLQNSVAGLLTRFLPSVEAFFVANASATRGLDKNDKESGAESNEGSLLVGGDRLFDFVTANKVLVNALIRSNSSLLEKSLKALVHVPRCRVLLDFDVKRHWFKSQLRRLKQQANRRHGSLRLHINRENVLINAYHQLRVRNADEMRGRLHITFRDEQGVDAGGLSREFFGILAKEIFNPNYALFTSTEDGSTFQPNPNSSINPDHLSYFRFVGRIVGKAVLDGYLLDAHFTRSLYKHMLGIQPTHHDMEAIDPDYYKNLKTILEYNLDDLGLELTFSIEDYSFGRSRMIDLLPNGRNVPVTEENKSRYVQLVCQHRMTTSIKSQIDAYLDGFYELVSRDLISIFTPRELELLISGLPDIDVHDLKQNTDYIGWKAADRQIQWFWNVLFSLNRNQKASFLQFVTGSSKVPLAGFGELPGMRGVQKFSIHKAGGPSGALMSAHTCFNSLDLPAYNSEEELREKLLYAITEGSGGFALA